MNVKDKLSKVSKTPIKNPLKGEAKEFKGALKNPLNNPLEKSPKMYDHKERKGKNIVNKILGK
jgi:hypothetical protein